MTGTYSVTQRPGAKESIPALVTVDVWRVPTTKIALAVGRMGLDRLPLRRTEGLRFWKLLGTGSGRTFTMKDADPHHWALLTVWDDPQAAGAFPESTTSRRWASISDEHARYSLRPLASRGTWAGRSPFGDPLPHRWDGPVAALTRARIKPSQWRTFWSAVPPVSQDLHRGGGMVAAMGIGEAPLGLQGTFSIWESHRALTEFAHRRPAHAAVMTATHEIGWYAEELFARFAVIAATGTFKGAPALPEPA